MYVNLRCNQRLFPTKNCKGLNQWALVTLGKTLIYINRYDHLTLTAKHGCPLFQQLFCSHQTLTIVSQDKLFHLMLVNQ